MITFTAISSLFMSLKKGNLTLKPPAQIIFVFYIFDLQLLNILKIKRDINQQDLKIIDLNFF